jgi:hypothetical protein
MVYQFPPDRDGGGVEEKTKPRSNQIVNLLVLVLIVMLVLGGVILYLRESGIDVRQLNLKNPFGERETLNRANEDRGQSLVITQAKVAADRLYLREGPGIQYVATYLLPENWKVSLIGDYKTNYDGEVWARVLVQTDEGIQEGWVSRRFLE